jgi:hypothetical protein
MVKNNSKFPEVHWEFGIKIEYYLRFRSGFRIWACTVKQCLM